MQFNRVIPFATSLLLVTLMACGGGDSGSSADSGSDSPSAGQAAATTALGTASVSGTVTFSGTAPEMSRVRLDKECRDLNAEPVHAQNVLVNENGTLQNVFVYVKEGLPDGYSFATPTDAVVFDQSGCMYMPHVFGVQVGQPLKILNSDPLLHNIHALCEKNRPFNFGMPKQGDERTREFRVPEVMVKIKCDVHPWMSAYAGVVDHPFHSVTGGEGSFSLSSLPAGTYTIEAWHEEYGTATQSVTVADGETATVDFDFGGAAATS